MYNFAEHKANILMYLESQIFNYMRADNHTPKIFKI